MSVTKRRRWSELETRDKLGIFWGLSFCFVVLATAAAILIPIFVEWLEFYGGEEEEVLLRRPAVELRLAALPRMEAEVELNGCRLARSARAPWSLSV